MRKTKTSENHKKLVLDTAEKSYIANEAKFEQMTKKQLYMLGALHGYSWAVDVFAPEEDDNTDGERIQ